MSLPEGQAGAPAGAAEAAPAQTPAGSAGGNGPLPGEDWHNIRASAKQYNELVKRWTQAGYQPDQLGQLVERFVSQDGSGGAYQPPAGPSVGPDDIRRIIAESFEKELMPKIGKQFTESLTAHQQQAQQEWQRSQAIADARRLRDEGFAAALKEWGHSDKLPDGTPNPVADMLRDHYQTRIWSAMDERRPKDLKDEQVRQFYETPTAEDVKKAVGSMGFVKSLKYAMAAAVAREQATEPNITLGAEPGGRQEKKWADMSRDERRDAIVPAGSVSEE